MKTAKILMLILLLLAPALAAAQTPGPTTRRARARTFLVLRLAEELKLPDEKALQLRAIMQRSDDRRRELRGQRGEVEKQLKAALEKSPPDEAAMAKLIAQANDIDQQISLIPDQSLREMQKILTVEQQARLVLFRPELQNEIRRAWRQRMKDGPRRPKG